MTKLEKFEKNNEFRKEKGIYCVVRKSDNAIILEDVASLTAFWFIARNLTFKNYSIVKREGK